MERGSLNCPHHEALFSATHLVSSIKEAGLHRDVDFSPVGRPRLLLLFFHQLSLLSLAQITKPWSDRRHGKGQNDQLENGTSQASLGLIQGGLEAKEYCRCPGGHQGGGQPMGQARQGRRRSRPLGAAQTRSPAAIESGRPRPTSRATGTRAQKASDFEANCGPVLEWPKSSSASLGSSTIRPMSVGYSKILGGHPKSQSGAPSSARKQKSSVGRTNVGRH